MIEVKLPSLGEGAKPGTVLNVLVKAGDRIAVDQPVVEIEAEKATIELPSPQAGEVKQVHVKVGDQVDTGALLLTLEAGEAGAAPAAKAEPAKAKAEPAKAKAEPAKAAAAKPAAAAAAAPAASAVAAKPEPVAAAKSAGGNGEGGSLPAGPAVRRLARLLGVNLTQVSGSGERGRIRAEDVHAHLERLKAGGGGARLVAPALPDFARWGEVTHEPLSGIRRATAEAMTRAWTLIPHVTNHELVDVTELEAARKAWVAANPDAPKLTLTVPLLRAVVAALKKFPKFNATLDLEGGRVVLKKHYHLGVAVDTPAGLLVPVVRDVDQKPLQQLSQELTDLAARARERKVQLEELKGGTFTISNLGGIGGWGFTPIINWPEVAILGVSRAREEYRPGPTGPTPRLIMPLSLSYDHRLIDGAEAARFLRYLGELLTSPGALLFAT